MRSPGVKSAPGSIESHVCIIRISLITSYSFTIQFIYLFIFVKLDFNKYS